MTHDPYIMDDVRTYHYLFRQKQLTERCDCFNLINLVRWFNNRLLCVLERETADIACYESAILVSAQSSRTLGTEKTAQPITTSRKMSPEKLLEPQ